VYVWFKDEAGNVSTSASDGITLVVTDITAPASPSININSSADNTNSIDVILSVSATDAEGVTGYYAKESNTAPVSNAAGWDIVNSSTNYSDNVSFTLSSSSSVGNHSRTVYIWFKDQAGNVSSSASDGITLVVNELTPPANPSISINSGAGNATSYNVYLSISATDNVGVTGYLTSETNTTPSNSDSGWTSITSTTSFSDNVPFLLSNGNNVTRTVYVWFIDGAGNISSAASDSIMTDLLTIQLNKLEWQYATAPGEYQYSYAHSYCSNLNLSSFQDWRLPTTEEVVTLVDLSADAPKIVAEFRDATEIGHYWFYTGDATISSAWDTYSGTDVVNVYCCSSEYYVRCVRYITWPGTRQFGTSSDDKGNAVAVDSSNNIYVTGETKGGIEGNTNSGNLDMFLVKYSSSGGILWTKQLGTGNHDRSRDLTIDSSDNIFVTGYTWGGIDGNTNSGGIDMFLVKYSSSGVKQWTKQLGTSEGDQGEGITVDNSGNIYVTGVTSGGLDGNTSAGLTDSFLVKYNSSGVKQWTKQLGTSSNDIAYDLVLDSSNNIYIGGYTEGNLDGNTNAGGSDISLVKYNSSGTKQWTKQFGSSAEDSVQDIAVDSSDNIYLTGITRGSLDGLTGSEVDMFLVKYSDNGTKLWTKLLSSEGNSIDAGKGLAIDSSDNIYVTGWTTGSMESNTNAGTSYNADIFLSKYNSAGTKQWIKQLGTSSSEGGHAVAIDSSNNIYVTGYTEGGLDGNTSLGGNNDVFLLKYNSSGLLQ